MESQPQNPEFRINPENFHPCTIWTFNIQWLTSYLVFNTVKGNIVTAATDLADAPIKIDSSGFLDVL